MLFIFLVVTLPICLCIISSFVSEHYSLFELLSLYTWLINSHDLGQSSRQFSTPDAALRPLQMTEPLFPPTAHKPFGYVSLKLDYQCVSATKCDLVPLAAEHHLLWASLTVAKLGLHEPPVIPALQTGTKFIVNNNTAKSSAYKLELCVLLPDTILSDQQVCEEALGVFAVSIWRLVHAHFRWWLFLWTLAFKT